MAHEVESMLTVGTPPWHQLGTILDSPPTVEEAIRLSGLDWRVELRKLYLEGGILVPDAHATVRVSDSSVLGVVGPRFVPLQNQDAFKWFNPFIESGEATIESAGALKQGRRVWILAKIAGVQADITKDDSVCAYILLAHAHDGTLAIRVGFTPVRVVCNNTLSYSLNENSGSRLIRVKHTGSAVETLDDIREVMDVAKQGFEATTKQFRLLASRQVNQADLETYVKRVASNLISVEDYSAKDLEAAYEKGARVAGKIIPLFESGRGNNLLGTRGTLWAAYNAVTEFTTHERGRSVDTRLESLWFGQSANMNRAALDIALQMAA